MGHDDPLSPPGLLDDGSQFVIAELLMYRIVDLGQYSTGRTDLDDLRTESELSANCLQALWDAVAECQRASALAQIVHPGEWKGMEVSVATRLAQDRPRCIDGRSGEQAFLDDPGQVHPEPPSLADGRESGLQSGLCVLGSTSGQHSRWDQGEFVEIERPQSEKVRMAIPQPRHEAWHR